MIELAVAAGGLAGKRRAVELRIAVPSRGKDQVAGQLVVGKWQGEFAGAEARGQDAVGQLAAAECHHAVGCIVVLDALHGATEVVLVHAGEVLQAQLVLDRDYEQPAFAQQRPCLAQGGRDAIGAGRILAGILQHPDQRHHVEPLSFGELVEAAVDDGDVVQVTAAARGDRGASLAAFQCQELASKLTEIPADRTAAGADFQDPATLENRLQRAQQVGAYRAQVVGGCPVGPVIRQLLRKQRDITAAGDGIGDPFLDLVAVGVVEARRRSARPYPRVVIPAQASAAQEIGVVVVGSQDRSSLMLKVIGSLVKPKHSSSVTVKCMES